MVHIDFPTGKAPSFETYDEALQHLIQSGWVRQSEDGGKSESPVHFQAPNPDETSRKKLVYAHIIKGQSPMRKQIQAFLKI